MIHEGAHHAKGPLPQLVLAAILPPGNGELSLWDDPVRKGLVVGMRDSVPI